MNKWGCYSSLIVFFALLMAGCSTPANSGQPAKQRKIYVQPIWLSAGIQAKYPFLTPDFEKAFKSRNVELITHDELMARQDQELKRIKNILTLRKEEIKSRIKSPEDVQRLMEMNRGMLQICFPSMFSAIL